MTLALNRVHIGKGVSHDARAGRYLVPDDLHMSQDELLGSEFYGSANYILFYFRFNVLHATRRRRSFETVALPALTT
jgi:hypothetical protein